MAMSESPPLPVAPCIVIGLVTATTSAEAALDATSELLVAMGARPLVPDGRERGRAFLTRDAGVVLASSHADAADSRFVLIEIRVAGELPGTPDGMSPSDELETESQRTRAFVARAFAVACERLAPLYAGLGVGWTPPPPSTLRTACRWIYSTPRAWMRPIPASRRTWPRCWARSTWRSREER
jgi:hypothetical protein